MSAKRCAACGKNFQVRPQVPRQSYCQARECQRKRRQRWQQETRRRDPDYRDNQSRAQQEWIKRNPNYWRQYRKSHPEYLERNRALQRERNRARSPHPIAKTDVSNLDHHAMSGIYHLKPLDPRGIAKVDVWTVEINFISEACSPESRDCKERT